mgnify:CR=1 FL=1
MAFKVEPIHGCKFEQKGMPCTMKGRDTESEFQDVDLEIPFAGETVDNQDSSLTAMELRNLRQTDENGEPMPIEDSLVNDLCDGNGYCPFCAAEVTLRTDASAPSADGTLTMDQFADMFREGSSPERPGTSNGDDVSLSDLIG